MGFSYELWYSVQIFDLIISEQQKEDTSDINNIYNLNFHIYGLNKKIPFSINQKGALFNYTAKFLRYQIE